MLRHSWAEFYPLDKEKIHFSIGEMPFALCIGKMTSDCQKGTNESAFWPGIVLDGGESRHRYVRKGEAAYWRQRAQAWQRFQKAMAAWVQVSKESGRV
jgi:hypothetical protein